MRIIAGRWRGQRLTALGNGDEAARLRPTPDRVRESLFSMIAARHDLEGARVLDVFAGTGALGLEALSRGAALATFIENGRVALKLLAANVAKLNADAQIVRSDATRLKPCDTVAFDLVFLDPPYGRDLVPHTLTQLVSGGWLAPNALISAEDSAPIEAPAGFDRIEARRYGGSHITLMCYTG